MEQLGSTLFAGQELARDRVVRLLALPQKGNDPPSGAVIHELQRVDAAIERLLVLGVVLRFVGAEHVGHAAKGVNVATNLPFEEAFLLHDRGGLLDVIVHRKLEVPPLAIAV